MSICLAECRLVQHTVELLAAANGYSCVMHYFEFFKLPLLSDWAANGCSLQSLLAVQASTRMNPLQKAVCFLGVLRVQSVYICHLSRHSCALASVQDILMPAPTQLQQLSDYHILFSCRHELVAFSLIHKRIEAIKELVQLLGALLACCGCSVNTALS